MLDARIKGNVIGDKYLLKGLGISEVQRKMQAFPVSHENVLAWSLKNSTGVTSKILKQRLEGNYRDLEFLETYFPGALNLMPEQYRKETKLRLERFLKPMHEQHWPKITSHSMTAWLESDEALQAKKQFDDFMSNQYPE